MLKPETHVSFLVAGSGHGLLLAVFKGPRFSVVFCHNSNPMAENPSAPDPYRVAKDIAAGAAGGIAQVLTGYFKLFPSRARVLLDFVPRLIDCIRSM